MLDLEHSGLGKSQGPGLQGHCSSHRIMGLAHKGTGGNVTVGLWRFAFTMSTSACRCQRIRLYLQNLESSILTGIYFPVRDPKCTTELIERR